MKKPKTVASILVTDEETYGVFDNATLPYIPSQYKEYGTRREAIQGARDMITYNWMTGEKWPRFTHYLNGEKLVPIR